MVARRPNSAFYRSNTTGTGVVSSIRCDHTTSVPDPASCMHPPSRVLHAVSVAIGTLARVSRSFATLMGLLQRKQVNQKRLTI